MNIERHLIVNSFRVFSAGAALALSSCSSPVPPDASTEPHEKICDGSDRLRLRFYMPGQPGRDTPGSAVTTEHGLPSFALDGLCRYWIGGGWTNHIASRFLAWRTGEAPAKLVSDLEALLDLKRLNTLAEGCVPSGIFDAAPAIIASEESFVGCVEFGGTMEEAWNLVSSNAEQLYDQGTSLDGAVRIVVMPGAPPAGVQFARWPWPLAQPAADFVLSQDLWFAPGQSFAVTDPADTKKLREIRDEFVAVKTMVSNQYLMIDDDGVLGGLYIRDALPYEAENGLWPGETE